MSNIKYFHFTVEGSHTQIIASIDEDNITTIISYHNGFRNDSCDDFEKRKKDGYEKGFLIHHEFSMADVLIPHLTRLGKDIDKIEPHDLLTIIEYRTKLKEKQNKINLEEDVDISIEPNTEEIIVKEEIITNEETDKEVIIEKSDELIILPEFYFFSKRKHCFHPSYPSTFNYRNKTFISVNQFIAYSKALIAKDDVSAFKILDYNTSNTLAKSLIDGSTNGEEISKNIDLYNKWKHLDNEINEINKEIQDGLMEWEEKRMSIMNVSTREKCIQNDYIKKTLIDTKEQKIVFAIQNSILGCGIKEADIGQDSKWCGVNELGKIYDDIKCSII